MEKRIEALAVEKAQLASAAGFRQEQQNIAFNQAKKIDGKIELLRELIEEQKDSEKDAKKTDK